MRSAIALLACVAILAVVNVSIAGKERLLAEGQIVYLELAPVDPRSIMQGDYMALNYQVANEVRAALPRKEGAPGWRRELDARDGRLVVTLDERGIGHFSRLDSGQVLAANEVRLRYRIRAGQLKFASNAFFFQEGRGGQYEAARYGRFRVAEDGDLLLTGLHDADLNDLGEQ